MVASENRELPPMTSALSRRGLAGIGAALLPIAAMTSSAQAQGAGESTYDRVTRTKTLRIAALPGELPYFLKDITTGEWSGGAIDMAKDIAKFFNAQLVYVESTYGNSVLDLQSNKIDLAFALNPTPARALAIGFTHPMIIHPFGCLAKHDLDPKTWADIDKPDIRIAYDIGSLHETVAKRFAPKAQLTGFKTRDDCTLALQSGRVDVHILAAILGLSTVGKNPSMGPYHLLTTPLVALPSALGIQRETDTRFVDVINAWLDYNRGIGQIREWLLGGLALVGVKPDQVPAELTF
jgi:polar amino acid transport system substrate-binding protein